MEYFRYNLMKTHLNSTNIINTSDVNVKCPKQRPKSFTAKNITDSAVGTLQRGLGVKLFIGGWDDDVVL